jgi:NADPH2:quinone reductase
MKAIGYKHALPITKPNSLLDFELPIPTALEHDLLVEVKAVSVNPVDSRVRASTQPPEGAYRVLGFDAAGVVKAIGARVTLFKPGDEVWYAGSPVRPGTNAEFHLVDERIVGPRPRTLDFSHSAAFPLTAITAWELLFDRLGVQLGKPVNAGSILIIGGAGGVGSIPTQLARKLTGLTIVSTISTPESRQWCLDLGAHFLVDHTQPFGPQLKAISIPEVGYIACLAGSEIHYPGIIEVLAPQGKIGMIDDPKAVDAKPLKPKAGSLHWEYMFTRSTFETADMIAQHNLLTEISKMVDDGLLRTTFGTEMGPINANNLKKAHGLIESGRARGKIVLTGF